MVASHSVISAEFSQSNMAEASQNTMRVAGRGHHTGIQKVAAFVCLQKYKVALLSQGIQEVPTSLHLLTLYLSQHYWSWTPAITSQNYVFKMQII